MVREKSAEGYAVPAQDETGVRLRVCGRYGRMLKAGGCEVGVGLSAKETRIICGTWP